MSSGPITHPDRGASSARIERRLRRAQATIDGLLHALPTLHRRVAELEAENDRLAEHLRQLGDDVSPAWPGARAMPPITGRELERAAGEDRRRRHVPGPDEDRNPSTANAVRPGEMTTAMLPPHTAHRHHCSEEGFA